MKNWMFYKILTLYILRTFAIRFFIVVFFASILVGLIDLASSNQFTLFNFFSNLGRVFNFAFFISSAWTIISMQKTREFVAVQVCTVSTLKIALIFFFFALLFSIFYIFVYNKVILQKTYPHQTPNTLYLNHFAFNTNIGNGNYTLLLLKAVNFNTQTQTLSFRNGDLVDFKEGKFTLYKPLVGDKIISEDNTLKMAKNQVQIEYNFNTLSKYFKESADKNSFQSIIQKIQLALEFKNAGLYNRKLEVDIFEEMQSLISFFHMILISLLFFANMPPRNPVLMRFFSATMTVATIYIINIILIGVISKLATLNSVLILAPSIIIFLIMFVIFMTKNITSKI